MHELTDALQRLHRYGPEFGGDEQGDHGLTNHGPMVVEVLTRRGLDIDVHRWLDRYVPRLAELPAATGPVTDWQHALGEARWLPEWTETFRRELHADTWNDVLVRWWPRLLPGLIAGSTHGVIRVGHAVRALRTQRSTGDSDSALLEELAHGLAFWASRWRALPGGMSSGGRDVETAYAHVVALPERSGRIADRITRLATVPGWSDSVRALRAVSADDVPAALHRLVVTAAARYAHDAPAAPVLLVHTATAPNAVLQVLPVLPRHLWASSLDAVWRAVAALRAMYATPGAAPEHNRTGRPFSAGAAMAAAAAHGDEHVLKFTDTVVDAVARGAGSDLFSSVRVATQVIDRPDA